MAETMTFKELFHHLEEYVQDPERRWHYVMRVKRHLPDPNDLGGLGKDQCYFEGAMEILRDIDKLELPLIYSGTLCTDETSRVKRLARLDCLKLPKFLENIENYRQQLRWIGYINGILPKPIPRKIKGRKCNANKIAQTLIMGPRGSNSSKTTAKRSQSAYSPSRVPSNMVLIHETDSNEQGTQQQQPSSGRDTSPLPVVIPAEALPRPSTRSTPAEDYSCILEKISSRLSFHDDLIKRVEGRLSCAALSLKQSEKIMLNGLEGKSGLVTSTVPILETAPTAAPHAVSPLQSTPVPSVLSAISSRSTDTSLFDNQNSSNHDTGNFSVQSRPPTRHGESHHAARDLLTTWVQQEMSDIKQNALKRDRKRPLLLRKTKTNL